MNSSTHGKHDFKQGGRTRMQKLLGFIAASNYASDQSYTFFNRDQLTRFRFHHRAYLPRPVVGMRANPQVCAIFHPPFYWSPPFSSAAFFHSCSPRLDLKREGEEARKPMKHYAVRKGNNDLSREKYSPLLSFSLFFQIVVSLTRSSPSVIPFDFLTEPIFLFCIF